MELSTIINEIPIILTFVVVIIVNTYCHIKRYMKLKKDYTHLEIKYKVIRQLMCDRHSLDKMDILINDETCRFTTYDLKKK